jgi:MFS family permease
MSASQVSQASNTVRPTAPSSASPIAVTICGCIVAFAYSANYTNHAPLVPALMREFSFNQEMAGFLTTGVFATHAAMQVPGGHLVDRFGAKRMLTCALIWIALGNLAIAFAGAYWQLLACKIFTGLGTAVCFVGGARYVHAGAAGPRLNVAQGFFGGSVQLGAGFVILAVPRIYLLAGWRAAFLVSGGMALAAGIIWLIGSPIVATRAAPPGKFQDTLLAPQLWLLGLLQMATFGLPIVVGSWVVVVLTKAMKIPATRAGLIGSLVLTLGIAGRPLGGVLRRHFGIRSLLTVSLLMVSGGCFMFVPSSISLTAALTAVVLIGIGANLPYAAMFSRAGALFPSRAGAAMGLVNMLGILMILFGAPLVGRLADMTGTFKTSFIVLGGFSLLACAVIPLIDRDEPAMSS